MRERLKGGRGSRAELPGRIEKATQLLQSRGRRLHRGLNPNVAYGCLDENQKEAGPARIYSVALVVVSPLSPAPG
ncbi:hypothetical protein EPR50_G00036280 [Perca flavescens]|uniref:Uncharacterized protein n=1 Tax=Perca flavescens TaxID=8167 RepID=A0A484DF36_PERFV|nr:hypothetical protein EPR50_G00036280 [Perca flavescens]